MNFHDDKHDDFPPKYTIFKCLGEVDIWNNTAKHGVNVAVNVITAPFCGGLSLLGVSFYTKAVLSHASQMNQCLEEVVIEIESLYKQINSLMIANLV